MNHAILNLRERTFDWSDPLECVAGATELSGREFLEAIRRGEIPAPPVARTLDFTIDRIEEGFVTFRMIPREFHYNPLGSVHGGVTATLLDSVMGCSIHSTLPKGRGYTTLEIKVNYLRAMTVESGELTAEGRVIQAGRQIAMAEGRVTDAKGRLCAAATTTCLVFDHP